MQVPPKQLLHVAVLFLVLCVLAAHARVTNPPRNLTIIGRESTNITLSWLPPVPRSNAPFEDTYILFHSNASGPPVAFPEGVALSGVLQATITELKPGNNYTVVAVAVNADGNSAPSNNVSTSTLGPCCDPTPDAPTLQVPDDIQIGCNQATTPNVTGSATGSVSCGNPVITFQDSRQAGGCAANFTITRQWTVSDACEQQASANQTITVTDVPPVLNLPFNTSVPCGETFAPADTGRANATHPCGLTGTTVTFADNPRLTVNDVDCAVGGNFTRRWTATDTCGLTAVGFQLIVITPTGNVPTPPVVTAPANVTILCNQSTAVSSTGNATITQQGNCNAAGGPGVVLSFTDQRINSTTCPFAYTLLRSFVANDACQQTSNVAVQNISVVDSLAPTLTTPAAATVQCGNPVTPNVTGQATCTEPCDGSAIANVTFTDAAGTGACANITRTWRCTSVCGRTVTRTQRITVVSTPVNPPVVVTAPPAANVPCDGGSVGPNRTGNATCSGGCSPPVATFADSVVVGGCPGNRTITRVWTCTDTCNASASANQTITVSDATPPVLVVPPPVTIPCGNSSLPAQTGQATATDACSTNSVVSFTDVVANDTLCPSGGNVTRTWAAVDECGNRATGVQLITVSTLPPPPPVGLNLTVPPAITVQCNQSTVPAVTGQATATTTCATNATVQVSFTDARTDGNCSASFVLNRTWTASDACGGSQTGTQTINVVNNIAPVVSVVSPLFVTCGVNVSAAVLDPPNVTLACNTTFRLTSVDTVVNGACGEQRNITRRWTAIDACGNRGTATQQIIVGSGNLTVYPPPDITLNCDESTRPFNAGVAVVNGSCDPNPTISFSDTVTNTTCGQARTIRRRWLGVDSCGNRAVAFQIINVTDNIPPVVTAPANVTVGCMANISPNVTGFATAEDCDANATVTFSDVVVNGSCPQDRTIQRTWTAVDACGNVGTALQVISVRDTNKPRITAPNNVTVQCAGEAVVSRTGTATAVDACDSNPVVTFRDIVTNQTCPNSFTLIREWTATDACGNRASANQSIVVDDTQPPRICLPPDVVISCSDVTEPSSTGAPVAIDNCDRSPTVIFNDTITAGNCTYNMVIERRWRAIDSCGQTTDIGIQRIVVRDSEGPLLSVPPDVTIECGVAPDPARTGSANATDACDPNPELTYTDSEAPVANSTCASNKVISRLWLARDSCANEATATQLITILDTTPPVLQVPGSVTLNGCNAFSSESVTGTANATDACNGALTATFTDARVPGGACPGGDIDRTWTATDSCGNTATAVQTLTFVPASNESIEATSVAKITAPPSLTLECTDSTGVNSTGFANASSTCTKSGSLTITFADTVQTGTCPQNRVISRRWTVVDRCGNTASATQTITVRDTIAPALTVPRPSTLQCVASANVPRLGAASASDTCDSAPTVSHVDIVSPGSCPNRLSIIRVWTARDACGNNVVQNQSIVVNDDTPPRLCIPPDVTVDCKANTDPSATGVALASDNCGTLTNANINFTDAVLPGTCPQNKIIKRTWTAVDACGNMATDVQTITVEDTTAPVLTAPPDIALPCSESTDPSDAGTARATDDCDPSPVISFTDDVTPGACPQEQTIQRTWTAVDACGNRASQVQVINVTDTSPPRITAPPAASLSCGDSTDPSDTGVPVVIDNCDANPTITFSDTGSPRGCGATRNVTRTWVAVDACGNRASARQMLVYSGLQPPNLTVPDACDLSCGDTATPAVCGRATATSPCDNTPVTVFFNDTTTAGDCSQERVVRRVWTAVDSCGLRSNGTQLIRFTNQAPIITAPPNVTVDCATNSSLQPSQTGRANATSPCGLTVNITFTDTQNAASAAADTPMVLENCAGSVTIFRVWTATDSCGASSSAVQQIDVVDNTPPVLTVPANITISCTQATTTNVTGRARATDACGTVAITFSDDTAAGSCPQQSVITRTFTATDSCGNSVSDAQRITIVDRVAPVLTLPANMTLQCDDSIDPSNTGTATATDACDDNPTVTFADTTSGSGTGCTAGRRVILRVWTAADACGNTATGTQRLTVQAGVITLTAPDDVTLQCADNSSTSPDSTGRPTVSNSCSGSNSSDVTVSFTDVVRTSSSCSAQRNITRTWRATDGCSNATAVQRIFVQGPTDPPTVTTPSPPVCLSPADNQFVCWSNAESSDLFVQASASCGVSVTRTFTGCTANQSIAANDCALRNDGRLCIRAAQTGNSSRLYTTTFDVSDGCGNAVSGYTQTVLVPSDSSGYDTSSCLSQSVTSRSVRGMDESELAPAPDTYSSLRNGLLWAGAGIVIAALLVLVLGVLPVAVWQRRCVRQARSGVMDHEMTERRGSAAGLVVESVSE